LCEGTQSDDVTEAEAADTQQLMTCRTCKYGWSSSSTQLYDNKLQSVEIQQQQQHVEDAAAGGDASNHDVQLHRHRR